VQDVEAFQALVAAVDVAGDVAQRMTHVQARSRRIREHIEHIILGTGRVGFSPEGMVRSPVGLPLLFNLYKVVFHEAPV
jgi:hypothetical protein